MEPVACCRLETVLHSRTMEVRLAYATAIAVNANITQL